MLLADIMRFTRSASTLSLVASTFIRCGITPAVIEGFASADAFISIDNRLALLVVGLL